MGVTSHSPVKADGPQTVRAAMGVAASVVALVGAGWTVFLLFGMTILMSDLNVFGLACALWSVAPYGPLVLAGWAARRGRVSVTALLTGSAAVALLGVGGTYAVVYGTDDLVSWVLGLALLPLLVWAAVFAVIGYAQSGGGA
jgi:hypothetical protein